MQSYTILLELTGASSLPELPSALLDSGSLLELGVTLELLDSDLPLELDLSLQQLDSDLTLELDESFFEFFSVEEELSLVSKLELK